MATAVRQSDTDGIAQCGMSRATPEASGHQHWATIILEAAAGKQTTINKLT
jgi:hypothetical protein